MGNESCDLDSAVCSIVYSYFLNHINKDKMESYLPLLNIHRSDFPLKTEVTYWLKKFKITEETLLFRNDIDLFDLASANRLKLHLVDHNVLCPNDGELDQHVSSVIDHHLPERTSLPENGMIVEPVGSCATLIAVEILKKCPEILENDVSWLLYGAILVDTVNLSESAKRATQKDIEVIKHLEQILRIGPTQRPIVFNEIMQAKSDISSLSLEQILRKDLKIVSENGQIVGMSSIPIPVQMLLQSEEVSNRLEIFSKEQDFDAIVVMSLICDDSAVVHRQLAVVSPSEGLRTQLSTFLVQWNQGELQLEQILGCPVQNCQLFHQRNTKASRKVVLPVVKCWLLSGQWPRLSEVL